MIVPLGSSVNGVLSTSAVLKPLSELRAGIASGFAFEANSGGANPAVGAAIGSTTALARSITFDQFAQVNNDWRFVDLDGLPFLVGKAGFIVRGIAFGHLSPSL